MEKGVLLIISGPSGSGKGTIVERLVSEYNYAVSISATTRKPRPNEKEGVHYFFNTVEGFKRMIENDELLEYAGFCGNYYGTPKRFVEEQLKSGNNIILEIEVHFWKQLYPTKDNPPFKVIEERILLSTNALSPM